MEGMVTSSTKVRKAEMEVESLTDLAGNSTRTSHALDRVTLITNVPIVEHMVILYWTVISYSQRKMKQGQLGVAIIIMPEESNFLHFEFEHCFHYSFAI